MALSSMKKNRPGIILFIVLLVAFFLHSNPTGDIREVEFNEKKMAVIHLKMGRSTVLSFEERPRKVVIGNQNYYQLEFIEGTNHLTLQPQGLVSSNLFVYGKEKIYGFLLHVKTQGAYDDIVFVKKKRPEVIKGGISTIVTTAVRRKRGEIKLKDNKLSINIEKVIRYRKGFFIVEASLYSLQKRELSPLQVELWEGRKRLKKYQFYFSQKAISQGEQAKMRVFVYQKEEREMDIVFKWKGQEIRMILPRKFFK